LDEAIEIAKRAGMPLKIAAKVDPADREYFESVIKPTLNHPLIEFVGEIGYPEKNDFVGNAAALLFPIRWPEPFGLVMIEAMACGTPVIAYPHGSVPEIMEDGVTGFIVPDRDKAIEAVHRIGELDRGKCRQSFEQRFSDSRMARDYLVIYERLIKGEAPPLTMSEGDLSWMKLESPSSTT
jgi:glycosyltransferase involved in cell wall biosynthesis